MANFVIVEHGQGVSFFNLDLVEMVTDIRDGHCLIRFASGVTQEFHGEGADTFVGRLAYESSQVDGSPTAESLERRDGSENSPKLIEFDKKKPES